MAGLDPDDWDALRQLGHRMLDDMVDRLAKIADGPVWQPMPDDARQAIRVPLPRAPQGADAAYTAFRTLVQPYATGNTHPGFMGWVHGGGNAVGMLAELLAAGLNCNLGGRDHAAIEIERQVIRWSAEMLGLPPDTAGGVMVTGASMANFIGVIAARRAVLGPDVRRHGLRAAKLAAYASAAAHGCVPRALDMAGLGTAALRIMPVDQAGRMRIDVLQECIQQDRAAGFAPFLVVGTAGSVDIGAIDDLATLGGVCAREHIWFHVDAAFGALAMLSPALRPLFAGMERADTVAFDFHKWGQAPYDAGCLVARDGARLTAAFGQDLAYLRREPRGLAANHPWPCDLGPDLSRGFRALKVWMSLLAYGGDALGRVTEDCCAVAQHLAQQITREPALELAAPVALNIVCFRVRDAGADADQFHADLVADVQLSGTAAPSTTIIDGKLVIRAAIVNHRTTVHDADRLIEAVIDAIAADKARSPAPSPTAP